MDISNMVYRNDHSRPATSAAARRSVIAPHIPINSQHFVPDHMGDQMEGFNPYPGQFGFNGTAVQQFQHHPMGVLHPQGGEYGGNFQPHQQTHHQPQHQQQQQSQQASQIHHDHRQSQPPTLVNAAGIPQRSNLPRDTGQLGRPNVNSTMNINLRVPSQKPPVSISETNFPYQNSINHSQPILQQTLSATRDSLMIPSGQQSFHHQAQLSTPPQQQPQKEQTMFQIPAQIQRINIHSSSNQSSLHFPQQEQRQQQQTHQQQDQVNQPTIIKSPPSPYLANGIASSNCPRPLPNPPSKSQRPTTHSQQDQRNTNASPSIVLKQTSPLPRESGAYRIGTTKINSPNPEIDFKTEVDNLMKMIQAKVPPPRPESTAKVASPSPPPPTQSVPYPPHEQSPFRHPFMLSNTDISSPQPRQQGRVVITGVMTETGSSPTIEETAATGENSKKLKSKKKYDCSYPNCDKIFLQKTHLDIHLRAHTGEKPFKCSLCQKGFSQLGNLKTHERRHTGEKPYACEICGKKFAQRGNVRAHRIIHDNQKPFVCRLDNCNKNFTQLGNLKSHQNKFHVDTLKSLTQKFATFRSAEDIPSEDHDLFAYFAEMYKNSNRGIKGRGKDRKISTTKKDARQEDSRENGEGPGSRRTASTGQLLSPQTSNGSLSNQEGNYGVDDDEMEDEEESSEEDAQQEQPDLPYPQADAHQHHRIRRQNQQQQNLLHHPQPSQPIPHRIPQRHSQQHSQTDHIPRHIPLRPQEIIQPAPLRPASMHQYSHQSQQQNTQNPLPPMRPIMRGGGSGGGGNSSMDTGNTGLVPLQLFHQAGDNFGMHHTQIPRNMQPIDRKFQLQ